MASAGPIRVHVVGGTYTVPAARLTEIKTALGSGNVTFDRVRTSGDRYDLAATIAARVDAEWESRNGAGTSPSVVLLANGADSTKFFDALALSPIAAAQGYPILLVEANAVPSATSNVLGSLGQGQRIVGGGPATVSDGVVSTLGATRVSGKDRYLNALAAADYAVSRGWLDRSEVGVAAKLPDALCAGATMGHLGGVSLITDGQSLTPAVDSWVTAYHAQIENLYIFGGPVSVTGTVDRQLAEALGG